MKLDCMGIRGNLLSWIAAFLHNREQRVFVEGQSSEWMKVISGVPQGSILGALLFFIYINDFNAGLVLTVSVPGHPLCWCAVARRVGSEWEHGRSVRCNKLL